MLETVREYGLEVLSMSGEMEATRQAHATYYVTLVEEAVQGLKSTQQAEWLERLEQEHDNVRATLSWMLEPAQAGPGIEMALRLVVALHAFWEVRGHYREALAYLEQVLASSGGVVTPMRAKALWAVGGLRHVSGRL